MEILQFVLGMITGGIISWEITHVYYKKSSANQKKLYNKLTDKIRNAILNDNREKLSVSELNKLIREKTIDKNVGEAIPYMFCPKCGSDELKRTSDVEVDHQPEGPQLLYHFDIIQCRQCGWTKTSNGYESPRDDI